MKVRGWKKQLKQRLRILLGRDGNFSLCRLNHPSSLSSLGHSRHTSHLPSFPAHIILHRLFSQAQKSHPSCHSWPCSTAESHKSKPAPWATRGISVTERRQALPRATSAQWLLWGGGQGELAAKDRKHLPPTTEKAKVKKSKEADRW